MEGLTRRVRTISAGSYMPVNIVTEAQSVLPSLTSAFSLEGVNTQSPVLGRRLWDNTESDRNLPSSYQDGAIYDNSEYTDTVQSNDSAFSLLRRSFSIPAEYRFGSMSPQNKVKKPHCKEIFQDFYADKNGTDTDSLGSYGQNSQSWRQTMADIYERPDYIDSLQSTTSGAALLAQTARAISMKRSVSLGTVTEIIDAHREEKKYKKNLLILSVSFMFMFTAYISMRNLQSSLHAEGELGVYALSAIYAMLFVGCIFATTIVQRFRPKPTMMLAMGANLVSILVNAFPSFWTLIPASALVGFALSSLWTAHATYLCSIAARYAEVTNKNLQFVLSKFNGSFFMFFQIGQILSGIISSTILVLHKSSKKKPKFIITNVTEIAHSTLNLTTGNVTEIMQNASTVTTHNVTTVTSLHLSRSLLHATVTSQPPNWSYSLHDPLDDVVEACGAGFCPGSNGSSGVSVDRHILFILIGILALMAVIGLVVMGVFLDRLEGVLKKSKATLSDQMVAVFKFFLDGKVMCLLPLMFYSLAEMAFMFGEFTKAFITCAHGVSMVGYVMMCLSASGALSSYVNGKVQQCCGRMPLLLTAGTINLCLLISMLVWEPRSDNAPILFIMATIWGAADGIWATQVISLMGFMFANNKEPAFAGLKMCQSLAATTAFALSPYMCTQIKIAALIILLILAMVGYLSLELLLKRQREPHIDISPIRSRNGRETPV